MRYYLFSPSEIINNIKSTFLGGNIKLLDFDFQKTKNLNY